MTREEAIKHLRNDWFMSLGGQLCVDEDKKDAFLEALGMALTALRPVSRKQVEKAWRGEWIIPTIIGGRAYNIPHCSACNGVPCGTDEHTRFCAHCGAPMTDKAVDMVMERLEALKDGSTTD